MGDRGQERCPAQSVRVRRETTIPMKDFKKLAMWQHAMDIVDRTYDLFGAIPFATELGLSGQAARASVSIASNIAEGNARRSEKEKKRYMEIALGSAFELETQVLIVHRRNWREEKFTLELLEDIRREQSMLQGFMERLHA